MMRQPFIVLMADDDIEDIEMVEDAIKSLRSDVQFHKVMNGKAVLKFLDERTHSQLPCLIILDYNMPELNGSQVLAALCQHLRYQSISKVIFSTSNAPQHIKECRDNGALDYFVKPTNTKELEKVVEKLMTYCNT
jgi:CheY-like chemotaxis protein